MFLVFRAGLLMCDDNSNRSLKTTSSLTERWSNVGIRIGRNFKYRKENVGEREETGSRAAQTEEKGGGWNKAQETVKKANHEMHDEHNILQIPLALGVHWAPVSNSCLGHWWRAYQVKHFGGFCFFDSPNHCCSYMNETLSVLRMKIMWTAQI